MAGRPAHGEPFHAGRSRVHDARAGAPVPGEADAGAATPFEQERRLREFGLSEYASRAYLALLKLGTTEARAVSRLGRVPIAKVYSTLDQLAERGLCVVEPGPPKRFTPVPIAEFLDHLAARYASQAQAVEREKEVLERLFPLAPTAHVDDRGSFQVLRGRRATLDKLRQLCEARPRSLLLHATDNLTARGTALPLLQAAHDAGARIRVLAHLDASTLDALEPVTALAEVRAKQRGKESIVVAVFDGEHALISHVIPDDGSTTRGQDVTLYTTEEAIVGALTAFVEHEWERAETFAEAAARLAAGDPPPAWRTVLAMDAPAEFTRLSAEHPGDILIATAVVPSVLEAFLAEPVGDALRRGQGARVVFDVPDLAELEVAERLAAQGWGVRHDPHAGAHGLSLAVLGEWVMFTVRGADRNERVNAVVTNDGRFRRGIVRNVQARWDAASTLAQRRAELTRYALGPAARLAAFEHALDACIDAVTVHDGAWRVAYANEAAAALAGAPVERMTGRPMADFVPGFRSDAAWLRLDEARRAGRGARVEASLHRDGGTRLLDVTLAPLPGGLSLLVARDVTTLRDRGDEAARTEALLRTAAQMLEGGYGWYDVDAKAGAWSDGVYDLLGLPPGAPLGPEALAARVHPHDRAAYLASVAEGAAGRDTDVAYRVVRGDGEVRHWRHRTRVLDVAGHRILAGAVADRTPEVEREARLAALAAAARGWWTYDAAARRAEWSPEARALLRLPDGWAGLPGAEDDPAARDLLAAVIGHALRDAGSFVLPWTVAGPEGARRLELAGNAVPGTTRVAGTVRALPDGPA